MTGSFGRILWLSTIVDRAKLPSLLGIGHDMPLHDIHPLAVRAARLGCAARLSQALEFGRVRLLSYWKFPVYVGN